MKELLEMVFLRACDFERVWVGRELALAMLDEPDFRPMPANQRDHQQIGTLFGVPVYLDPQSDGWRAVPR